MDLTIFDILFFLFVVGIPVLIIIVFRKIAHKKKWNVVAKKRENEERKILHQLTNLGSTPIEREKGILKLFNEKKQSVFFIATNWPRDEFAGRKNRKLAFPITKSSINIAALDNKSREFLKLTFLLFNYDKISYSDFRDYSYQFINDKGNAVQETHSSTGKEFWFQNTHAAHNSSTGIKSSEQAISRILSVIENLPDSDPVKSKVNAIVRGGGIWLSDDDLKGSIFDEMSDYKLQIGHLHETNTILNYSGEGSLITIAPPGSGKTQCFVLPNMLSWQGAAFVLDIKGEIYSATHDWRSKNVGKIYKFSPLDPDHSHSYNPLTFIRQETDFIWEDARFLADMMIVPSGSPDPFWENIARDIVTSAIAYVCLYNAPAERPMSKVLDLMYGIGLAEMIVALKSNDSVSAMRQIGHSLFEMERKTIDSALKTAQTYLSAWQGERINRVTKKSDWSPMDLRNGKPTIYICINPNEIDSYLSLLRVIIAQHIRLLSSKLPERNSPPILFMLDELPRLKKMLPVEEALNIGRQYNVKLWMFAQSYGQLKQAYPNTDGFLGSCAVRMFMNIPLNDELATKISDQLGYKESPFDNSRQKMVEPLELAGPEYKDIVLVIAANSKPAKVSKKFAWQDEELRNKMG